jgi:putative ABC transport system permease protein
MIRIVVNEEFVRRLGLSAKQSLNQQVRFGWGPEERSGEIIGVVANHHQLSLKDPIQAIAYMQPQWTTWKYFSINVSNRNSEANRTAIEQAFKKIFPDNSFVSFYLDDYYNQQYRTDQKMGQMVGIFTGLAIVVTCLGLMGLTIFSVSQRTKEIGIRKVLGSPVSKIIYLFSQDLVKILIGAYIVAVPIILLGGQKWLSQFAFSVGIEWLVVVVPLVLLLFITVSVVTSISFRRAVESPVKALKYE